VIINRKILPQLFPGSILLALVIGLDAADWIPQEKRQFWGYLLAPMPIAKYTVSQKNKTL